MKQFTIARLFVALVVASAACQAQEIPEMPKPTKEHQWLEQLVGKWESESEITMAPGQPPLKSKGTEQARSIGGFWVISHSDATVMEIPITGIMTLGYDAEKQKYVGTWIDSATGYLWNYTGTVDSGGKLLTLETEGPCPMKPGEHAKFKETIEIKSPDHKVFTSSMQGDDGTWQTIVTVHSRRKK